MHADPVGPGIGKGGDELVGVLDHQVAIEGQVGRLAQALHHRRPEGDVGHKMPVHDVHVDDRAAAPLGRGDLVGKPRKIRRQNRWKQLNHSASLARLPPRQCISRTELANLEVCDYLAVGAHQHLRRHAAHAAQQRFNGPLSSASGKNISPTRRTSGR